MTFQRDVDGVEGNPGCFCSLWDDLDWVGMIWSEESQTRWEEERSFIGVSERKLDSD